MKNYLGGKITVSIIGAYCERYINGLFDERIPLSDIRNEKGVIYAQARRKDYLKIAKLSRKYGARVRVVRKKGLFFRILKYRKRVGLILGTALAALMILILRQFVWHIDIHDNYILTDDYILRELEENGLTAGTLSSKADVTGIERRLMRNDDNIQWINIEINGSRADVYINESGEEAAEEIAVNVPCNVIAGRDGVIVESEVYSGNLLYENGSGVIKGGIIVSGVVSSGNGGLILAHADAKIIAEYTDKASFSMDRLSLEKVPGSEVYEHDQLMLLGFVFPLDSPPADTSDMICTEYTQGFTFCGIELPFKIRHEKYIKQKSVTVEYKTEDIYASLDKQLELYIENMFGDQELIDVKKSYESYDGGIRLDAEIKLRGNIAKQQVIMTAP